MKHHDAEQNRLLDALSRNAVDLHERAALIEQSVKNSPVVTRYAMENARQHFDSTGGIERLRFLMAVQGSALQQFIYQTGTEDDDTIDVLYYDGFAAYGTVITIGKPPGLRRSDYDGNTVDGWTYAYVDEHTRTRTNDGTVDSTLLGIIETQTIDPSYESVEAIIFGVQNIGGFNADLEEVDFVDQNIATRRWESVTGDGRWELVATTQYDASSANPITVTSTQGFSIGMPIKAKIASGTYYAAITNIIGLQLLLSGASVITGTILALYRGKPEMLVQVDTTIPGNWDASTSSTLLEDNGMHFTWKFAPGYLVGFTGYTISGISGSAPKINVTVFGSVLVAGGGTAINSAGAEQLANLVSATHYRVSWGTIIDVTCATTGSANDASDLTVSMFFVLE